MLGYVGLFVRLRGPVATPRLFQGFACSCCGLKGVVLRVVLRGGFILWFVVLMLVIQGGGFISWFEGVLDKVRVGMYFLDEGYHKYTPLLT